MKKDLMIAQLEHIVNYEYDFYDTKEEVIKDIERILKGEIVFDELLEDIKNLCFNCGNKKEDYEGAYCDKCWKEEQKRIDVEIITELI